jgi:hypothetical protein
MRPLGTVPRLSVFIENFFAAGRVALFGIGSPLSELPAPAHKNYRQASLS